MKRLALVAGVLLAASQAVASRPSPLLFALGVILAVTAGVAVVDA